MKIAKLHPQNALSSGIDIEGIPAHAYRFNKSVFIPRKYA